MALFLPQRWRTQPTGSVGIDPNGALGSGLLFASSDVWGVGVGRAPTLPTGWSAGRLSSPIGTGFSFTGTSTQYARFNTHISVAAADPVTVEAWVIGSAYPSLSSIASLSASSAGDGTVAGFAGELRGMLAFTGTAPCDIYAWGGSQDYDSNIPFVANTPQHIVVTKAPGTGAVLWSVYRNGFLVASGNSSNGSAWVASGPYFYVGARHPSGAAPITGVISKTGFWNRTLSAAEVAALYQNPWQVFRPQTARIYSFPSGAGNNYTLTGAVTHTLTPAGTFSINRQHSIAGAVTLTLTPSATLAINRAYTLAGAVTHTLTPSAAFDIDRAYSLSGAVTLTLSPAATMAYTAAGSASITGDVTYTLTPAATFAINRAYTLTGAVTHSLSVAAAMQYTAQQAIEFVGAVTYTMTPQAVMVGPTAVVTTPVGGGIGHRRKKRKLVVNGRVYTVDEGEEAALLAKLRDDAKLLAALAEEQGEPEIAQEARKRVVRLVKRLDKVDSRAERITRLRTEDEQILSLFIDLLAA